MWSHAQVWCPSTAGVVGYNPAEHMVIRLVLCVCCLSSRLCNELITRSEESYRVCVCVCVCVCLVVCDLETSKTRRIWLGCCATENKEPLE